MTNLPPLPLPDAPPDPESEDYTIEFRTGEWGACRAIVRNEYGDKVDVIHETSFQRAYDTVRINYPQAHWDKRNEGVDHDE